MTTSNQLDEGMMIALDDHLYEVESATKVAVTKGAPFIKVKLIELATNKKIEKNFKPNQTIEEVTLEERPLEFLYPEKKHFLCLDLVTLDQVLVPENVVGRWVNYLREGVEFQGLFHGDQVVFVRLPQFLEIMVVDIQQDNSKRKKESPPRKAILETGAEIEVPAFIEIGDIVKVDTTTEEFVQRV